MNQTLTIDNAPLTPMAKKALCDIVMRSFASKQTIFDAAACEKREQILEQYKKAVGYEKMRKEYDQAKGEVTLASERLKKCETKIEMKGLTVEGYQYTHSGHYYGNDTSSQKEIKRACDKVEKLLSTANAQGMDTSRDKVIASIWCANTTAEGNALVSAVLGKGEPLVEVNNNMITYKGGK